MIEEFQRVIQWDALKKGEVQETAKQTSYVLKCVQVKLWCKCTCSNSKGCSFETVLSTDMWKWWHHNLKSKDKQSFSADAAYKCSCRSQVSILKGSACLIFTSEKILSLYVWAAILMLSSRLFFFFIAYINFIYNLFFMIKVRLCTVY